jgi:hypothetical protein
MDKLIVWVWIVWGSQFRVKDIRASGDLACIAYRGKPSRTRRPQTSTARN